MRRAEDGRDAVAVAVAAHVRRMPRRYLALLERRLCRRNPILGEVSEGAVAPEARLYGAPSE
jgi:hypothetical protein